MSVTMRPVLQINTTHAVQAPTGRWFLAGLFPAKAGYERVDGKPLTQTDVDAIRHCGPRIAGCRTKTYSTQEEALKAAEAAR